MFSECLYHLPDIAPAIGTKQNIQSKLFLIKQLSF